MHVILADPSRTVQKAVAQILEARGHLVEAYADGCEALEQLRNDETVDALITSTEPLGISGVELCWEARLAAGPRRPIYVLMMSSSREQKVLCEALDSGADDFIDKPPAAEELYARIRAAERLAALERDLIRLATTDPLTGVLNRRAFFESAHAAVVQAAGGMPLSAIMIDIDHFKWINDNFGHKEGDVALIAVTKAAMAAAPKPSILGRLGGEEFSFVLPGKTVEEAAALAELLRAEIAALHQDTEKGDLSVTCSLGVADWQDGDTIDCLLKRADDALYVAKSSGRNQVVVSDERMKSVHNPSSVIRSADQRIKFKQKETFRASVVNDPNQLPKR